MLKKLRFLAALYAAKLSYHLLIWAGRQSFHYPGWLARRIDPDFLRDLPKPDKVIAVTGSNGKTTVSNYLVDFLEALGEKAAHNRSGGNFQGGIVTGLLRAATLTGKPRHRFAVLEIDELIFSDLQGFLQPDIIVVTNLSRDHYERVGSAEYLFDSLNASLSEAGMLILNADDLISARLVPQAEHRFYKVGWKAEKPGHVPLADDLVLCPVCDHKLLSLHRQFNHIGEVRCPGCGLTNPPADFDLSGVDHRAGTFTLSEPGGRYVYDYALDSVIDAYNIVAALAAMRTLGYGHEALQGAIGAVKRSQLRFDTFRVGAKKVIKLFAKTKSPIGTSRSFEIVAGQPGTKSLLILPEDFEPAEMRDSVSWLGWLYDTDFELLNDDSILQIVVGGWQAEDYRVRLNLAGVPDDRIITVPEEQISSPDRLDLTRTDTFFVLYQNFFKAGETNIDLILKRLQGRLESLSNEGYTSEDEADG